MIDQEKLKSILKRRKDELERGIYSLDDDDQILAVVIMRLVFKRLGDMERILND